MPTEREDLCLTTIAADPEVGRGLAALEDGRHIAWLRDTFDAR